MTTNYDQFYKDNPDALGPPTKRIVTFFQRLSNKPHRVLDVGCGQGRDAIFIALLGHEVVGVDISPNGISQMECAALKAGVTITGKVADIQTYSPEGLFDVVLFDRTLHMLAEPQRLSCLARLLHHVAPNGWVVIEDEARNLPALKSVMSKHSNRWELVTERRGHLVLQLR